MQTALNAKPVLSAFLQSCHGQGIRAVENSLDADAAVIWSVLWNGRMLKNKEVYEHYRQQGKPVIIIDVGALHRNITWKIAINNINAFGIYGHTENLDYDRPKKLNIKINPYVKKSDAILIAAQHSKSLQVSNLQSVKQWISDTVADLRKFTDREIVVRPHPRSPLALLSFPEKNVLVKQPVLLPSTYDSFNIDYNYYAVVNYNSGPGIQSALNSCPTIVDSSSLAYPVSNNIKNIDNLVDKDRQQWLVEIAHTEYTVNEIADGLWFKRLEQYL